MYQFYSQDVKQPGHKIELNIFPVCGKTIRSMDMRFFIAWLLGVPLSLLLIIWLLSGGV